MERYCSDGGDGHGRGGGGGGGDDDNLLGERRQHVLEAHLMAGMMMTIVFGAYRSHDVDWNTTDVGHRL